MSRSLRDRVQAALRYSAAVLSIGLVFVAWSAGAAPALWQVRDDDTTIHIFGTVHVLKPGTEWVSESVKSVLADADRIYMEVSAEEQQNVQLTQKLVKEYGMLPKGETLTDRLPEDTAKRLKTALVDAGAMAPAVSRMKPWFAGMTYTTLRFVKLGYDPASGVEPTLVQMAQKRGTPVNGLETLEYQFSLFDSLSESETTVFIETLLAESKELETRMKQMTEAWTSGDLAAVDALLLEAAEKSPGLMDALLDERNKKWAREIRSMLDRSGEFLVAVGVGHLAGEGSVISRLRKAGFTVERLH